MRKTNISKKISLLRVRNTRITLKIHIKLEEKAYEKEYQQFFIF